MPRFVRFASAVALLGVTTLLINLWVHHRGTNRITNMERAAPAECILVLGAGVWGREPSPVLEDRLATALALYRRGAAPRILVSGDHASSRYDEPGTMARWLTARGVPEEAIFLDHAGFDTHSSMVRARRVFGATDAIVVTQAFHLPRSLYLGEAAGLRVQGVAADRRTYPGANWFAAREVFSRTRAVFDSAFGRTPRHLGPRIDMSGDGRRTHG